MIVDFRTVKIYSTCDWDAMYVDGELVYSNNKINISDVTERLEILKFDEPIKLSYDDIDDILIEDEDYDDFDYPIEEHFLIEFIKNKRNL